MLRSPLWNHPTNYFETNLKSEICSSDPLFGIIRPPAGWKVASSFQNCIQLPKWLKFGQIACSFFWSWQIACIVYIVYYTLYTIHCMVYIVYFTLHTQLGACFWGGIASLLEYSPTIFASDLSIEFSTLLKIQLL